MATKKEQIYNFVVEELKKEPNGLRHAELTNRIQQRFPEMPEGTVYGGLYTIIEDRPNEVYKPARGLFRLVQFREAPAPHEEKEEIPEEEEGEEALYAPFARWLVGEEECTKAIPLGGNRLGRKWGTPDVVGVYEPKRSDIYKLPVEVVSAEIKTNKAELLSGFGQACAYKLFSHKSYLVVPGDSTKEDLSRLDSLCQIFGIGLVIANPGKSGGTDFASRMRAVRGEPDPFYVNEALEELEAELLP